MRRLQFNYWILIYICNKKNGLFKYRREDKKTNSTKMELKELCRLCTMALKGPHIDCLENAELCESIRMVYNIHVIIQ